MDPLLSFLVGIIVLCVFLYIAFWAMRRLALPEPVGTVIIVLVALVVLVFLVQRFDLFAGL